MLRTCAFGDVVVSHTLTVMQSPESDTSLLVTYMLNQRWLYLVPCHALGAVWPTS
jgi:hypothetical protein